MTAYCPLARGKVPGNETLERIGKAHGKSASQVALHYLVQLGIIPIPRTANPDHLAADLAVFDFKLGDGEMAEIAALKRADGRVVNPPHAYSPLGPGGEPGHFRAIENLCLDTGRRDRRRHHHDGAWRVVCGSGAQPRLIGTC